MKKDKSLLTTLLNAFKLGHVDRDYVLNYILDIYSDSRRFNLFNFQLGFGVGLLVMWIIKYFAK